LPQSAIIARAGSWATQRSPGIGWLTSGDGLSTESQKPAYLMPKYNHQNNADKTKRRTPAAGAKAAAEATREARMQVFILG